MISEELITYKTAQLAKQAGFDLLCSEFYQESRKVLTDKYDVLIPDGCTPEELKAMFEYKNSNMNGYITAPTQSLLQRWIREVYNIHMYPTRCESKTKYSWVIFEDNKVLQGEKWKTYELALEQALQEALTIIINRKETSNGI